MTRLVDVFLYAGEQQMLDARVDTLARLDVEHLAVIANRTHQGDVVPDKFVDHRVWCAEYAGCSTYVVDLADFDGTPGGGAGLPGYQVRERAHRNRAAVGAVTLAGDAGLVMLSDADEIPHPDLLVALEVDDVAQEHVLCLAMRMHVWTLEWQYPGPWLGTTIARSESVAARGLQWMRDVRGTDACRVLGEPGLRGGWHLTWQGDIEDQRTKLQSFSHGELAGRAAVLAMLPEIGEDINGVQLDAVDPTMLDWPEGIRP